MYEDRIVSENGVLAEGAVVVFDLDIIFIAGIAVTGILQIGMFPGIGDPAAPGGVDGISGLNVYAQAIPVFRRGFIANFSGEGVEFGDPGGSSGSNW
jgi:hypothetical protein